MRAFYRAAVDEGVRPTSRAPHRLLAPDRLFHELREDEDESDDGRHP